MTVFRFILLTLASFRLTRLVTDDDWPPTKAFRDWLRKRTGHDSGWTTLFSCPWCFGVWMTFVVFAVHEYVWQPPTWLLASVAAMGIVGYLGAYSERP